MRKLVVISILILCVFQTNSLASDRVSLGYIYSMEKSHTEIVDATKNSVNVVSPTAFGISNNGTLKIDENFRKTFVDEMHQRDIKVTPFLSNNWGKKLANNVLNNPDRMISNIVDAIAEYNLDGINIDIENIDSSMKDKLTNFVKLLREALPEDKILSVAVAANPNKLTYSWIAAYDYKALAEYSDYLVLMAYDEHCYAGSEGEVASISFVEKSIQVMLEEVSREKILMGIPLYGRFWKEGEDVGGEAIIIGQVEHIIKKYKLVPKYNISTATPVLTVKVEENEFGPYVNGRFLDEGTYRIYYENESSIREKLKLANKYNLLGTALWALDNESDNLWTYYKECLNENEYESEREVELRKTHELMMEIAINKQFEPINIVPNEFKDIYKDMNFFEKINQIKIVPLLGIIFIVDDNHDFNFVLEKNKKRC